MNLSRALLLAHIVATSASLRGNGVVREQEERELITRIIGGDSAEKGRYSYAVSLQDSLGHFCGGTLIAHDIVLSAAHCVQHHNDYKAIVGRHDLSTDDGDEVSLKTEILHPEYDKGTTDNDFMVIVLDRPTTEDVDLVQLSPNVVPVATVVTVMVSTISCIIFEEKNGNVKAVFIDNFLSYSARTIFFTEGLGRHTSKGRDSSDIRGAYEDRSFHYVE